MSEMDLQYQAEFCNTLGQLQATLNAAATTAHEAAARLNTQGAALESQAASARHAADNLEADAGACNAAVEKLDEAHATSAPVLISPNHARAAQVAVDRASASDKLESSAGSLANDAEALRAESANLSTASQELVADGNRLQHLVSHLGAAVAIASPPAQGTGPGW